MRARRLAAVGAAPVAALALAPGGASAHGISARSDLPIPEWLFVWAAIVVLIVSFAALAALWPRPKLEGDAWRPLPRPLGRALTSRPVEIVGGALGALLLLVVIWSGLVGQQVSSANFAPNFVYILFWVGLVPVSLLFGDVFRVFNPWRAIGHAVAWSAGKAARQPMPAPLAYPERLGCWPATVGVLVFAWFELAYQGGDSPRIVALAAFGYSAVTFIGMAMYGVEPWIRRAETFSVYFNLFARLSPWERRDRDVGLRPPLAGLTKLEALPGTTTLLAVMIGTVTFDGASEGPVWQAVGPPLQRVLAGVGLSPVVAGELATTVGLLVAVAVILGLYRLGVAGARSVGGEHSADRLARAFVHSLVPIALVYAAAHYMTLLIFQGQSLGYLASDPLGIGWNLFGTAELAIDYTVIGAAAVWYLQVAMVVAGHVAALMLAHDRALVLYDGQGRLAVRSQYWMLGVMVAFTTLALWLLAQANG